MVTMELNLFKEMLHTELLETWDEKGLPLEDFSVAGPKKKIAPRRKGSS